MRSSGFSCRILQVWRGRWSRTRSAWRGLPIKVGIIVVVGDAAPGGGWLAGGQHRDWILHASRSFCCAEHGINKHALYRHLAFSDHTSLRPQSTYHIIVPVPTSTS
jgi:hypothetical protein